MRAKYIVLQENENKYRLLELSKTTRGVEFYIPFGEFKYEIDAQKAAQALNERPA